MVFRIFSVQKDGSYHEVPPVKESLVHEGDAFLIISRKDKEIYIYRKTGISRSKISCSKNNICIRFDRNLRL